MTYFISDLHFSDKKIISFCNRPFKNINEMNKTMIKNWNNVVTNNDEVYIIGDLSLENISLFQLKFIINKLKGKKYLIRGNHDILSDEAYIFCGIDKIYDKPILINDFIILQHEPPYYLTKNIPYFYLYGHIHNSINYKSITENSFCVCVERINYTPISTQEIRNKLEKLV